MEKLLIHYFALPRLTDSLLLVNMLLSIHDRHLMSLSIIIRLPPQTKKPKDRAIRTQIKPGVNSGAAEELAVPVPHVTPVVLLLNDTNII
jgi:hypothetical protein